MKNIFTHSVVKKIEEVNKLELLKCRNLLSIFSSFNFILTLEFKEDQLQQSQQQRKRKRFITCIGLLLARRRTI